MKKFSPELAKKKRWLALNKIDLVEPAERKKRCADAACTEMMSEDPSCSAHPFCGAGICELGG